MFLLSNISEPGKIGWPHWRTSSTTECPALGFNARVSVPGHATTFWSSRATRAGHAARCPGKRVLLAKLLPQLRAFAEVLPRVEPFVGRVPDEKAGIDDEGHGVLRTFLGQRQEPKEIGTDSGSFRGGS